MRYISAIPGTFIALGAIILVDIFLPQFDNTDNVEIILTLSTFLFAILAGFIISRLTSRFDGIRDHISGEDATLLSLYKTCQHIDAKTAKRLGALIDEYYIYSYDFSLSESQKPYKYTAPILLKMWDTIGKVDKRKHGSAYQVAVNHLAALEQDRNGAAVNATERLGMGNWLILLILAGIILISVFFIRTDLFYSHFITVALSSVLVLVLLIIRDLQNFMLGGKSVLEESGQEVLELIGKTRYYNESFVRRGISKPPKGIPYRLGHHKPGSTSFDIELIDPSNDNARTNH